MTSYPLQEARILFIDADGVFRRIPDGSKVEGIEDFEEFLRIPEFQDVLVVAAGEWKDILTLDRIRQIFADDIASRIVDITPNIENSDECKTHVEINLWLANHPEVRKYAVLEYAGQAPLEPVTECGAFVGSGEVFSRDTYRGLATVLRMSAGAQQQGQ